MNLVADYINEVKTILEKMPQQSIWDVINVLFEGWRKGKKVFILGNGGSAATASHFANDLNKGTIVPGKPRFKAIALTDNVPLITAWANDTSYENIFAEQLRNLVDEGDIVIGISGSGRSANVLKAMELARKAGAITIGWTGMGGGKLKDLVDYCIIVPSDCIEQIEDMHMLLDHCITVVLRQLIAASE